MNKNHLWNKIRSQNVIMSSYRNCKTKSGKKDDSLSRVGVIEKGKKRLESIEETYKNEPINDAGNCLLIAGLKL